MQFTVEDVYADMIFFSTWSALVPDETRTQHLHDLTSHKINSNPASSSFGVNNFLTTGDDQLSPVCRTLNISLFMQLHSDILEAERNYNSTLISSSQTNPQQLLYTVIAFLHRTAYHFQIH